MDVELGLTEEKLVRQAQAPSELQHELLELEAPLNGAHDEFDVAASSGRDHGIVSQIFGNKVFSVGLIIIL